MKQTNLISKLIKILNNIANFYSMSDSEKKEFTDKYVNGFIINIIGSGKGIVSDEILKKITTNFSQDENSKKDFVLTIEAYLKEMNESENGKMAITNHFNSIINQLSEDIKSLPQEQKLELQKILEE